MSLFILEFIATIATVPFDPLSIIFASLLCCRLGWTKIVGYNGLEILPLHFWFLNVVFSVTFHAIVLGSIFLTNPTQISYFYPWLWYKTIGGFVIWWIIQGTLKEANVFGFVGVPSIFMVTCVTVLPVSIVWVMYLTPV